MNILVLSNGAWDDQNAIGNTLSNLFEGWSDADFSCIYSRDALPDNKCCTNYYTVSTTDLIKNLFRPGRIGRQFHTDNLPDTNKVSQAESNAVKSMSGWKRKLAVRCVDRLYDTKVWLNNKIKSFITEVDPDIVFLFAISDSFRYHLVKYIKKHTAAKVVMFIADDVYGAARRDGRRAANRYGKFLKMADKVYGISNLLCEEYQNLFDMPIEMLYKGCMLEEPRQTSNKPIEIVYAGNLYYGRDKTLSALASALNEINKNDTLAKLSIYTGSFVTDEMSRTLNIPGSSEIVGRRPYEEIKGIMKHADIVLHVESFDPKQMEVVRLSFSTKITDCLQSGAVLMAIGPSGIASIEYSKMIDGAVVINNTEDIAHNIKEIVNSSGELPERAKRIHAVAMEKHDINNVRSRVKSDFSLLIK